MSRFPSGYVFAEFFNNLSVNYGDYYNPLRHKGYSASLENLVFAIGMYGSGLYGTSSYGEAWGNNRLRWEYTSSLTQSFYNANPSIDPSETLLTIYQNFIPTSSYYSPTWGVYLYPPGPNSVVDYTFVVPTRPSSATYTPLSGSVGLLTGEYYYLAPSSNRNQFAISTASAALTDRDQNFAFHNCILSRSINWYLTNPSDYTTITSLPGFNNSGSFKVNIPADATHLHFILGASCLTTGSVFILRNLSLQYPIDPQAIEPRADTQDYHLQSSTGMVNARYNGSKLTSPDFNQNSPDTIDKGPVVVVKNVNPNTVYTGVGPGGALTGPPVTTGIGFTTPP